MSNRSATHMYLKLPARVVSPYEHRRLALTSETLLMMDSSLVLSTHLQAHEEYMLEVPAIAACHLARLELSCNSPKKSATLSNTQ